MLRFQNKDLLNPDLNKFYSAKQADVSEALLAAASNLNIKMTVAETGSEILAQWQNSAAQRLCFFIFQESKEKTWIFSGPEKNLSPAEKQAASQILTEVANLLSKRGSI